MIKVGSEVTWTYQAGGIEFSQTGKILSCVGNGCDASKVLAQYDAKATTRQKKFQDTSMHNRYLIVVMTEHGVATYYCPMQSVVNKQNPGLVIPDEVVKSVKAENKYESKSEVTSKGVTPVSKVPELGSDFFMGNSTKYRICGLDGNGGFVGYRMYSSDPKMKFLVSKNGFTWTYHSNVREAYSGFVKAVDGVTVISGTLTIPESHAFVGSITEQLTAMGFKDVDTSVMLDEVLAKAVTSNVRRVVKAAFVTHKY